MTQYKLVYFNFRGRAEVARYMFAVAGQEYEDFRFEREEWSQYKGSTPFGQVPVLEVTEDGKTVQIAQSLAIDRYLGRKFGMYGKDELEMAEIDMYADQITDLGVEMVRIHFTSDEAKKKEMLEKLQAETLPNNMKFLEDKLAKSSSGFLVGDSLSWLDFHLIVLFDYFHKMIENLLPQFPNIVAHDQKIRALPKVAEWIAERPVTST